MITLLIQYTLIYATVLCLVALGGMFSERSGIINIGLEGIMVVGALGGALALNALQGVLPTFWLVVCVILIAVACGFIYSMLLAVATIHFNADQTITGTALNILSTALAVVVARAYNGSPSAEIKYDKSAFLFNIGDLQCNVMTIICLVAVVVAYVVLYKTRTGMRLMACGEHPQAANSVGINVYKMRYLGVAISGVLGGLGGIAYIFPSIYVWDFANGVSGYGFLALAVMIFGQWKPILILLVSLLFGVLRSLSFIYSGIDFLSSLNIPGVVYKILPYVVSLIMLALTAKHSRAPKAEGIPYDKGSR